VLSKKVSISERVEEELLNNVGRTVTNVKVGMNKCPISECDEEEMSNI